MKNLYVSKGSTLKLDKILVKNIVHSYTNMEVVTIDPATIEQAIDISVIFQLSFWDSLILSAAEHAHCEYLLSEDLNNGQNIRGIRIVNPFHDNTGNLLQASCLLKQTSRSYCTGFAREDSGGKRPTLLKVIEKAPVSGPMERVWTGSCRCSDKAGKLPCPVM